MPVSSVVCSFAINIPVYHLFDYIVDEELDMQPGQRYLLPFGSTQKMGVLVSVCDETGVQKDKIKPVLQQIDAQPVLSSHLIKLAVWMADYYCQPLGEVLFQFLPRYLRQSREVKSTRLKYWISQKPQKEVIQSLQKRAPRQHELFEAIVSASPQGVNAAGLRDIHTGWHPLIKTLEEKGLVRSEYREALPTITQPVKSAPQFTNEQVQVDAALQSALSEFKVHVLQGVTGSGKTELYLSAMQHIITQGKQVIYLVPEIGLTPQLLQRLQSRLGCHVVTSHSAQSELQRYQSWEQFNRGVAEVIIGTRSALFSDTPNLGLIVIDEEHDASYRQQDGVRYHARDVAIKRAQMLDIPIVLGTATPSSETLHNLEKKHYRLHRLTQRPLQAEPPAIELIDTRNLVLNTGCSEPLLKSMQRHLDQQGQVLLFLNRRGFAPVLMCHGCGWQAQCFQCDARMTLHRSVHKLICHHCGFTQQVPQKCPECKAKDIQHYGVGTQQLESFLRQRFSDIDVIRIDRDSVSSAQQFEQKLQPVQDGKSCILLGTQMLAKGHDYPNISLVGILDADQALFSSFYRAAERLIQTVLQVSGRAGRASSKGQALLQTAFSDHPLMQGLASKDYTQLIEPILQERKLLKFPPYVRVVTLQVDALELESAISTLETLKKCLVDVTTSLPVKVIGPIPALMTRRIGRYRAQLSFLSEDFKSMRHILQQLVPHIERTKNSQKSRLTIEVDPLDL